MTQQTVYAADSEYEDWTEAQWPAKAKNYAPQFIAAAMMLLERAPRVQPQDRQPPALSGQAHLHAAVEAARAQQRGVEHVEAAGVSALESLRETAAAG